MRAAAIMVAAGLASGAVAAIVAAIVGWHVVTATLLVIAGAGILMVALALVGLLSLLTAGPVGGAADDRSTWTRPGPGAGTSVDPSLLGAGLVLVGVAAGLSFLLG